VLLQNQTNLSGNDDYFGVDGFFLKVQGPPPGMKDWTIPAGARVFSPVGGFAGLGLEGFSSAADPAAYDQATGTIGMAGHLAFGGIGTTLTDAQYHNVLLKFAATDTGANLWNPLAPGNDPNFSKGYRYLRSAAAAPADPSFAPWIINKTAGYPYQDFNYSVPFSAWDMETTPPTRLAVGMFENNAAGASVDGRYWPPTTTGNNQTNREFAFIFAKPYSETVDPTLAVNISNNATTPLMWVITCARRTANPWPAGNQFLIEANHVATRADVFSFVPTAPVTTLANSKVDIQKINVFPNPYFGFNSKEPNKYTRFVTFNHLPPTATLNIINLAGVRVRTLLKNDPTQFMTWDLLNSSGLPVAAGVYIVYVDMGPIGTKILKLSIIPEAQQLDKY
jgi:hypothetical protein